jgi:hypothetical protein
MVHKALLALTETVANVGTEMYPGYFGMILVWGWRVEQNLCRTMRCKANALKYRISNSKKSEDLKA